MSALVFVLLVATLYPPAAGQTLNVIGSLAGTPQFSAFNNLAAPIRNELDTPNFITVFAPTNLAVQQFLASLPAGFNDPPLIRRVLLYHVAPGLILLENITQASPIQTLDSGLLTASLVGTSVAINNSSLILSQFPQVNGNIFTINRVLVPPGVSFAAPIPTSVAPIPTSEETSAVPIPTSEQTSAPVVTETLTPAPPQVVGICTSQACCTSRAFPNVLTGDGYLEFNPICNDGGLHCDDDTGCLLCHDPSILLNLFNRPLCNATTTVIPYSPCADQACCTAKMTPNTNTGYGYLEFVSSCAGGGANCLDSTGCVDCYNPLPGTVNILSRPVCSAAAIQSFGFVPPVSATRALVETAISTEEVLVTGATTVIVASEAATTVAAKRALLEVAESGACLALPAFFGVFLAAVAMV